VIAKEDYDTALSNKNQAEAQVVSAQAAVDSAALNLEFTRVTSPIDGRVSRQLVNIGNLVQADTTELTTVVSVDPIYAYFHVDELAELRYQRLVKDGKLVSSREGGAPVYLQLQDETGFPHEGIINFADNAYDSSTGTLLVRGTFRNPDGFLVPGTSFECACQQARNTTRFWWRIEQSVRIRTRSLFTSSTLEILPVFAA